ncbi:unnamed protein product, partial [Rotaria sp. Silwood1]
TFDDDTVDDGAMEEENNEEETFQIQSSENDKKFVLVNTRIDYQYRSETLNNIYLYEFVSTLYKKKMNATDMKHLSTTAAPDTEVANKVGRPRNERFAFQEQHPQATTHLLMKHSQAHIPVLYGPQIPRCDRQDTRERYC